jgi:hypothetical protein
MARGANAKVEVANILKQAFGASYIGEFDKKYYVWANDGGEQVQISIALTCPKNPVGESTPTTVTAKETTTANPWDKPETTIVSQTTITQEEKDNIERLKKFFDL